MLHTLAKLRIKLKSAHILAVLFLGYIAYVGIAALPTLLINTGNNLLWKEGPQLFIRAVDEQYEGMLTTEKQQPLLQNKADYINFNGLMAKVMGQSMMNDRVMLNNGHLASLVSDAAAPEDIQNAANNVINFYKRQTEKGGNFLFVMVSSQVSKYEDLLPIGYTDTTNETADKFLSLLTEAGVPCLDLRDAMQEDGLRVTDFYFTTDHHWKPQGGFWAYGKILEKLAQMAVIGPVDSFYTDPDHFTFQTYPNTFLGSWGKRTGIYYAGLDDSIFIQPNFDTDISVTLEERGLNIRGRFEEVAYNTAVTPDYTDPDYYQENAYGLYGWGDTQLTQWRNANAPEQGKFLLIGESFGNVPFSLLSLYLSECDEMDMRYFPGDFSTYYRNSSPDTVILEVNVDQTLGDVTTYPYFPNAE